MYDTTKPYISEILGIIKATWNVSAPVEVLGPNDCTMSFPSETIFTCHVDGVGTKGKYHWKQRTFREAVQDALAMNVNDLSAGGAKAFMLSPHIQVPRDDHNAVVAIMKSLANECIERDIAIVGGETAITDTLDGMEISLFVSGYRPNQLVRPPIADGDVIIGLLSSGLHSNSFTKVRELFGRDEESNSYFTDPTRYYDRVTLSLQNKYGDSIHGIEHITGGAFTRLKKLLSGNRAILDFTPVPVPGIFYEIYRRGVSDEEMFGTFNCGIGMVFIVAYEVAEMMILECAFLGQRAFRIGRIDNRFVGKRKCQIHIHSPFSSNIVSL